MTSLSSKCSVSNCPEILLPGYSGPICSAFPFFVCSGVGRTTPRGGRAKHLGEGAYSPRRRRGPGAAAEKQQPPRSTSQRPGHGARASRGGQRLRRARCAIRIEGGVIPPIGSRWNATTSTGWRLCAFCLFISIFCSLSGVGLTSFPAVV